MNIFVRSSRDPLKKSNDPTVVAAPYRKPLPCRKQVEGCRLRFVCACSSMPFSRIAYTHCPITTGCSYGGRFYHLLRTMQFIFA